MGIWDKSNSQNGYESRTKGGYLLAHVRSVIQKEIRRGQTGKALFYAVEMHESKYLAYLLNTLSTILLEDCGPCDPEFVATTTALITNNFDKWKKVKTPDKNAAIPEFYDAICNIVMNMSNVSKSRVCDDFSNFVIYSRQAGMTYAHAELGHEPSFGEWKDAPFRALSDAIARKDEIAAMWWAIEVADKIKEFPKLMDFYKERAGELSSTEALALTLTCDRWKALYKEKQGKVDWKQPVAYGVIVLCRPGKFGVYKHEFDWDTTLIHRVVAARKKGHRLDVGEYAFDGHTDAGRRKGRHSLFWLKQGSKVAKRVGYDVIGGTDYEKEVAPFYIAEAKDKNDYNEWDERQPDQPICEIPRSKNV